MPFAFVPVLTLAVAAGHAGEVRTHESVALSSTRGRITVDALAGRITLVGAETAKVSALCPSTTRAGGALILTCVTRHLRASVRSVGGRGQLVIEELFGAPVLDGDATLPLFSYAVPHLLGACEEAEHTDGLGRVKPTWSRRAECAFVAGRTEEAISLLVRALEDDDRAHAALRLGDAALLTGDVERAAEFWDSAGAGGLWTRLAAARLCDVLGNCTGARPGLRFDPLDAGGLEPVLADELALRSARVMAYRGDVSEAVTLLVTRGDRACQRAPALCRRLALQAMREGNGDRAALEAALALAVATGIDDRDATSAEIIERAAELVSIVGAPRLAAGMLTSTSLNQASEAKLLRAAELYLEAEDAPRALTIARYATTRKRDPRLKRRWDTLLNQSHAIERAAARNEEAR